jgi:hypothetical protein
VSAHERLAYASACRGVLAEIPGLLRAIEEEGALIGEVMETTAAVTLMSARPALRALASHLHERARRGDCPPLRTLHWLRPASGVFLVLRGGGARAVEICLADLR